MKKRTKKCKENDRGGLPVMKVVFVEEDKVGIEGIYLTKEPNHGYHFIYFESEKNDENTDKEM